jgi:hypothetical protein
MSLPEYIATIGEESPAQELICDDNLTKYHWDSPTLYIVHLRYAFVVHCVKRYAVSRGSIQDRTLAWLVCYAGFYASSLLLKLDEAEHYATLAWSR